MEQLRDRKGETRFRAKEIAQRQGDEIARASILRLRQMRGNNSKDLEEYIKKISPSQLTDIAIEICNDVAPTKRRSADIIILEGALTRIPFFRKFLAQGNGLSQVCQDVKCISVKKGEVLFREGEMFKEFYLIFRGSASVLLNQSEFDTSAVNITSPPTRCPQKVNIINQGTPIGEIIKVCNQRWSAGLICEEDCLFLHLANTVELTTIIEKEVEDRVDFLRSVKMFESFSRSEIEDFMVYFSKVELKKWSTICEDNKDSDCIFIVQKGQFRIFKSFYIQREADLSTKRIVGGNGRFQKVKDNTIHRVIQVGLIGIGEICCEVRSRHIILKVDYYRKQPQMFTIQTISTEAEILKIDASVLFERVLSRKYEMNQLSSLFIQPKLEWRNCQFALIQKLIGENSTLICGLYANKSKIRPLRSDVQVTPSQSTQEKKFIHDSNNLLDICDITQFPEIKFLLLKSNRSVDMSSSHTESRIITQRNKSVGAIELHSQQQQCATKNRPRTQETQQMCFNNSVRLLLESEDHEESQVYDGNSEHQDMNYDIEVTLGAQTAGARISPQRNIKQMRKNQWVSSKNKRESMSSFVKQLNQSSSGVQKLNLIESFMKGQGDKDESFQSHRSLLYSARVPKKGIPKEKINSHLRNSFIEEVKHDRSTSFNQLINQVQGYLRDRQEVVMLENQIQLHPSQQPPQASESTPYELQYNKSESVMMMMKPTTKSLLIENENKNKTDSSFKANELIELYKLNLTTPSKCQSRKPHLLIYRHQSSSACVSDNQTAAGQNLPVSKEHVGNIFQQRKSYNQCHLDISSKQKTGSNNNNNQYDNNILQNLQLSQLYFPSSDQRQNSSDESQRNSLNETYSSFHPTTDSTFRFSNTFVPSSTQKQSSHSKTTKNNLKSTSQLSSSRQSSAFSSPLKSQVLLESTLNQMIKTMVTPQLDIPNLLISSKTFSTRQKTTSKYKPFIKRSNQDVKSNSLPFKRHDLVYCDRNYQKNK